MPTALLEAYLAGTMLGGPPHGSPMDRGSADAYYGRPKDPHKYPNGTGNPPRVALTDPFEIECYHYGYDNEYDRKDWG